MGFLRELGQFAGKVAGTIIGGPIQFIGELTDLQMVEDIGKGVKNASTFTGDTLGQFADGTVNTVAGLFNEDANRRNEGLKNMGSAVGRTAKGVYHSTVNTVKNGGNVISGAIDGDIDKVKKGAAGLATTLAVGALSIGVIDVLDIDADADSDLSVDDTVDNPDSHYVHPHHVNGYTRADGTVVSDYWRDGDGNPSTHLTSEQGGGYIQSNPDKISG